MEMGLMIYFSALVMLDVFFLGGVMFAYFSNKEAKTRGLRIVIFNILFVLTTICIGGSGAYMTFQKQENVRSFIESPLDAPKK